MPITRASKLFPVGLDPYGKVLRELHGVFFLFPSRLKEILLGIYTCKHLLKIIPGMLRNAFLAACLRGDHIVV